jgi:hypothetical protein
MFRCASNMQTPIVRVATSGHIGFDITLGRVCVYIGVAKIGGMT